MSLKRSNEITALDAVTFNQGLEIVTSAFFLALGVWSTAFAYGFVGEKIIGGFHWNSKFPAPLRWLGPLLVQACLASLVFFIYGRRF